MKRRLFGVRRLVAAFASGPESQFPRIGGSALCIEARIKFFRRPTATIGCLDILSGYTAPRRGTDSMSDPRSGTGSRVATWRLNTSVNSSRTATNLPRLCYGLTGEPPQSILVAALNGSKVL